MGCAGSLWKTYDLNITHFAYKLHQSHPPPRLLFSLFLCFYSISVKGNAKLNSLIVKEI
jgi:hypothetical protein